MAAQHFRRISWLLVLIFMALQLALQPVESNETAGPFQAVAPIDLPVTIGSQLRTFDDEIIWLITGGQVASFQMETDTWEILFDEYPGELIDVDTLGRVWVLGDGGAEISVWRGGQWSSYDQAQGWSALKSSPIRGGIAISHLDQVWLATPEDVRVFDGQRWMIFSPEDMNMPPPEIEDGYSEFNLTYVSGVNQIWVSECDWIGPGPNGGRGVRWYDGTTWKGVESPVATGCATALQEDEQGDIWVGLDSGLWRFNILSEEWQHYPTPDPPEGWNRFGFVNQLNLAPDGDPWVTMQLCDGASCFGGLARYHLSAGEWTLLGEVEREEGYFNRFIFDVDKTPWLLTDAGLYKIVADVPEYIAPLSVWDVVVENDGDTWVGAYFEGQNYLWKLVTGET